MLPENQNAAPELFNREQDDEGQAPDIEAELRGGRVEDGLHDTVRPHDDDPGALIPDDVPDLVDKIEEMVSSGRIDTGAFAGEPMHDDEESLLGNTEDQGDDRDDLSIIGDEDRM